MQKQNPISFLLLATLAFLACGQDARAYREIKNQLQPLSQGNQEVDITFPAAHKPKSLAERKVDGSEAKSPSQKKTDLALAGSSQNN
jgi:hypothetical protein